jgi:hypothetical protein
VHADRITSQVFWDFVWSQKQELIRYLRWASRLRRME